MKNDKTIKPPEGYKPEYSEDLHRDINKELALAYLTGLRHSEAGVDTIVIYEQIRCLLENGRFEEKWEE